MQKNREKLGSIEAKFEASRIEVSNNIDLCKKDLIATLTEVHQGLLDDKSSYEKEMSDFVVSATNLRHGLKMYSHTGANFRRLITNLLENGNVVFETDDVFVREISKLIDTILSPSCYMDLLEVSLYARHPLAMVAAQARFVLTLVEIVSWPSAWN